VAELIYLAITSLDGYVADEQGDFGWGEPDDEVHAFVNDLERPIGTSLYGRRLYEVMIGWETMHTVPDLSPATYDFARLWQAAEKVVYSRTLTDVATTRTRLERDFDVDRVRAMKAAASADLSIGGAELAGQAIAAGLVDRYHFIVSPVAVGGGKPALPGGVRLDLQLLDVRRFGNGVVHLHYVPRSQAV
jgi:dihydrofolate reductase